MSRSRAAAPLKRDSSHNSLQSQVSAKKILPAPVDPKITKSIKHPSSQGMPIKSPFKKTKGSQSISNLSSIQTYNPITNTVSNNLDLTQKIHLSRQYEQSRIMNASTAGSYSQSSFTNNNDNKQREKNDSNLEHSRQLSTSQNSNTHSSTNKKQHTPPIPKIQSSIHSYAVKEPKIIKSESLHHVERAQTRNHEKENQAINFQKKIPTQQLSQVDDRVPANKNEEKKQKPQILISSMRPPNKCSFKDSFVDSDNFHNVEEKLNEEKVSIDCHRKPRQKSLHDMIKEKFIGPIMTNHGNSNSLMKRNILVTGSNLSARSSTCSIKSSFLPMSRACNTKTSFQSNQCGDTNIYEVQEDIDENINQQKHCCDNIKQYAFMPKTIFSEIVSEIHSNTRTSSLKGGRFSQLVTAMPQSLFTVEKISKKPKLENSKNDSFSNSSPYYEKEEVGRPSEMTSSVTNEVEKLVEGQSSEFSEEAKEESDVNAQEDIIEFLQSDTHKMHLIQTLQSLQYVKLHLKPAPQDQIKQKRVKLPPFRKPWITKTIVFDLDETLVHCVEDFYNNKVDKLINVKFPNGDVATAGINIRPFAIECLKRASELFQVVVFTASHCSYADVVLDILDPNHEIFEKRLYRDSCIRSNDGVYVKDLRIFEPCRRLEDIVIVDNAVYSFGYQLENGIPIIPFYDDKEDEELLHLTQYLECLVRNGGDVRDHNKKAFQLRELQELDVQQFLSSMLYDGQQQAQAQEKVQLNSSKNNNTQNSSNTQWEILNVDTSIINEEPNEDEESSIQETSRLQRKKYELQFVHDNEEEEQSEEVIEEDCQQRVVTNTSILERESFE